MEPSESNPSSSKSANSERNQQQNVDNTAATTDAEASGAPPPIPIPQPSCSSSTPTACLCGHRSSSSSSSSSSMMDPLPVISLTVAPTTGGQFELKVSKLETIDNLKKTISKRLKVPKERICLLWKDRYAHRNRATVLFHSFFYIYTTTTPLFLSLLNTRKKSLTSP